ncbi:MAG: hypothetical protein ACO1N6_04860 [Microcella sp.]
MNLRLPGAIAAAIVLGGLLSVSGAATEPAEARSCLRAPSATERQLCEYRALLAQQRAMNAHYSSIVDLQRRINELQRAWLR